MCPILLAYMFFCLSEAQKIKVWQIGFYCSIGLFNDKGKRNI
ncbi:hypothetical protein HMPREF0653_02472 [Prevotella disiens JCM 6334 = ATCC 29426]|uniref:Uncharacterized protein n=1 Tax=Prevotella disiens JCM 6334 = ATCC 29426 TaxID=1235811 RepID=A0ABN0NP69_9BACT|nr:hypothetical protein HMPREF0653_02472 [Prevotella disiens JCM 6334 = ATCC 29426]